MKGFGGTVLLRPPSSGRVRAPGWVSAVKGPAHGRGLVDTLQWTPLGEPEQVQVPSSLVVTLVVLLDQ